MNDDRGEASALDLRSVIKPHNTPRQSQITTVMNAHSRDRSRLSKSGVNSFRHPEYQRSDEMQNALLPASAGRGILMHDMGAFTPQDF